jgi:hypothetical protein
MFLGALGFRHVFQPELSVAVLAPGMNFVSTFPFGAQINPIALFKMGKSNNFLTSKE